MGPPAAPRLCVALQWTRAHCATVFRFSPAPVTASAHGVPYAPPYYRTAELATRRDDGNGARGHGPWAKESSMGTSLELGTDTLSEDAGRLGTALAPRVRPRSEVTVPY